MSEQNTQMKVSQPIEEKECPFVSEKGPSCSLCGAPPISVNLDESGRYGFCDECGGRFPLGNKSKGV